MLSVHVTLVGGGGFGVGFFVLAATAVAATTSSTAAEIAVNTIEIRFTDVS
jgi:hypothetical protein